MISTKELFNDIRIFEMKKEQEEIKKLELEKANDHGRL
jgi:hypothetical protein